MNDAPNTRQEKLIDGRPAVTCYSCNVAFSWAMVDEGICVGCWAKPCGSVEDSDTLDSLLEEAKPVSREEVVELIHAGVRSILGVR